MRILLRCRTISFTASAQSAELTTSRTRFDALVVEPLPGERGGGVGLVLVVGEDDLYRTSQHLPAEIVDRHARGCDASLAANVGVGARHVEQQAQLLSGALLPTRAARTPPQMRGEQKSCPVAS